MAVPGPFGVSYSMTPTLVPCPNCSRRFSLGLWDFGLSRGYCDGFCPECHGRYRFSAKLRFAGVMAAAAWLAVVLITLILLHAACPPCRNFRGSPLGAFAPLFAAAAFIGGWLVPPSLAMRGSARMLLLSRRGSEILDSLETQTRRLQLKALHKVGP